MRALFVCITHRTIVVVYTAQETMLSETAIHKDQVTELEYIRNPCGQGERSTQDVDEASDVGQWC